jgi:hypothetical protein
MIDKLELYAKNKDKITQAKLSKILNVRIDKFFEGVD